MEVAQVKVVGIWLTYPPATSHPSSFLLLSPPPLPVPVPPDSQYQSLQITLVDCPGHASLIKTIIGGVGACVRVCVHVCVHACVRGVLTAVCAPRCPDHRPYASGGGRNEGSADADSRGETSPTACVPYMVGGGWGRRRWPWWEGRGWPWWEGRGGHGGRGVGGHGGRGGVAMVGGEGRGGGR